jgi:hypothetical protein
MYAFRVLRLNRRRSNSAAREANASVHEIGSGGSCTSTLKICRSRFQTSFSSINTQHRSLGLHLPPIRFSAATAAAS